RAPRAISLLSMGAMSTPVRLVPMRVFFSIAGLLRQSSRGANGVAVQFGARLPQVACGDGLAARALGMQVAPVSQRGFRFLLDVHEVGAAGAQVDLTGQRLAHELALALEGNRIGQRLRQDLRGITALVLLEQFRDQLKMAELVVQETLPDGLDARI